MKHTTLIYYPEASGYFTYELNFYEPGMGFSWHPGCVAQRLLYNQWRQKTTRPKKSHYIKFPLHGVRGYHHKSDG